MLNKNLMRDRQRPLTELYKVEPATAWVTDEARTDGRLDDPLHSCVFVGPHNPVRLPVGVHTAVGGDSDDPTPGDILCAALASCLDSTLRLVANRIGIEVVKLNVTTTAEVDVRGTLLVSSEVPVRFQKLNANVDLQVAPGVEEAHRTLLLQMAEKCCIVLDTLRHGVEVTMEIEDGVTLGADASASPLPATPR